ncbi:hypothetical protein TRVL_10020 [Trypanosoma vivax]|nr:hypothetical protein TRVL_10020 [Trypanosoma vivax]
MTPRVSPSRRPPTGKAIRERRGAGRKGAGTHAAKAEVRKRRAPPEHTQIRYSSALGRVSCAMRANRNPKAAQAQHTPQHKMQRAQAFAATWLGRAMAARKPTR